MLVTVPLVKVGKSPWPVFLDNPITEKLLSAVHTMESLSSSDVNATELTVAPEQYTTSLGSAKIGLGQVEATHKVVFGFAHETPVGVSVISI